MGATMHRRARQNRHAINLPGCSYCHIIAHSCSRDFNNISDCKRPKVGKSETVAIDKNRRASRRMCRRNAYFRAIAQQHPHCVDVTALRFDRANTHQLVTNHHIGRIGMQRSSGVEFWRRSIGIDPYAHRARTVDQLRGMRAYGQE